MSKKIDITRYVAEQEKLPTDQKSIRRLLPQWWQNPRNKEIGGLKLTDEGFARLTRHFKAHQVKFEHTGQPDYTNKLILRLDNFITCPWYINNKGIWVFDDKMAIQLVLFSGDIVKFSTAKAKSLDASLK